MRQGEWSRRQYGPGLLLINHEQNTPFSKRSVGDRTAANHPRLLVSKENFPSSSIEIKKGKPHRRTQTFAALTITTLTFPDP